MRSKPIIVPAFNVFDRWDILAGFPTHHITATAATSGNPVENLLDPRRYVQYQANSTTTFYVKVTMTGDGGIPVPAGWAGPTVWGLAAVSGFAGRNVSVVLAKSSDDITYTTIDSFTKNDDRDVVRVLAVAGGLEPYYRVTVTWADAQPAPYVGWLITGEYLELERYPEDGFDPYNRKAVSSLEGSREGQFLGWTSTYEKLSLSPMFANLTEDFVQDFSEWWQGNLGRPLLWLWDPGEHPLDVFYVSIVPDWDRNIPMGPADLHTLNLDMVGVWVR